MVRLARLVPALATALFVPGVALAQAPTAAATATAAAPPAAPAATPRTITVTIPQGGGAPVVTPSGGGEPADKGGSAPDAKPPKAPQNLAGYGYGNTKPAPVGAPGPVRRVARARPGGPIATYPGFEITGDGSSRLFVQLTQQVPVEEKRAAGSITYVLKGARVNVGNNRNALVTVHFNTPVTRARLVSVGNDLHFVVELRSAATPTFNMSAPEGGGGAVLSVVFPKGDFITGNEDTDADAAKKALPAPEGTPVTPKKPKKK